MGVAIDAADSSLDTGRTDVGDQDAPPDAADADVGGTSFVDLTAELAACPSALQFRAIGASSVEQISVTAPPVVGTTPVGAITIGWATTTTLGFVIVDSAGVVIHRGEASISGLGPIVAVSAIASSDAGPAKVEVSAGAQFSAIFCDFSGSSGDTTWLGTCDTPTVVEDALASAGLSSTAQLELGIALDAWSLVNASGVLMVGGVGPSGWELHAFQESDNGVNELQMPEEVSGREVGLFASEAGVAQWTRGFPIILAATSNADGTEARTDLLRVTEDQLGYEVYGPLATPPPSTSLRPGQFVGVFKGEVEFTLLPPAVRPEASTNEGTWAAIGAEQLMFAPLGGLQGSVARVALPFDNEPLIRLTRLGDQFGVTWLALESEAPDGRHLSILSWDIGSDVVINPDAITSWTSIRGVDAITRPEGTYLVVTGQPDAGTSEEMFVTRLKNDTPCADPAF